jgi:hypothetical protein
MKDGEKRNAAALAKFKANRNHPRCTTMELLQEELRKIHPPPSTLPTCTGAMKCETVGDQLRHREACLARVLRKGSALKLVLLLESFAAVLQDEWTRRR